MNACDRCWRQGPLSIEEQKAMIAHIGIRARWDDPQMDVYNELDPRRTP